VDQVGNVSTFLRLQSVRCLYDLYHMSLMFLLTVCEMVRDVGAILKILRKYTYLIYNVVATKQVFCHWIFMVRGVGAIFKILRKCTYLIYNVVATKQVFCHWIFSLLMVTKQNYEVLNTPWGSLDLDLM